MIDTRQKGGAAEEWLKKVLKERAYHKAQTRKGYSKGIARRGDEAERERFKLRQSDQLKWAEEDAPLDQEKARREALQLLTDERMRLQAYVNHNPSAYRERAALAEIIAAWGRVDETREKANILHSELFALEEQEVSAVYIFGCLASAITLMERLCFPLDSPSVFDSPCSWPVI